MSTLDFIDYRDQSKSFVGMAAMYPTSLNSTSDAGEPARATTRLFAAAKRRDINGLDMTDDFRADLRLRHQTETETQCPRRYKHRG